MKKILVSACLLGEYCRYDGGTQKMNLTSLQEKYILIPVCPEVAGGLSIPRDPSERIGDKVISIKGKDVTREYNLGANYALKLAQENDISFSILKSRSPSCGCGQIYDGTFSGTLCPGDGVTAELLKEHGYLVLSEETDPGEYL